MPKLPDASGLPQLLRDLFTQVADVIVFITLCFHKFTANKAYSEMFSLKTHVELNTNEQKQISDGFIERTLKCVKCVSKNSILLSKLYRLLSQDVIRYKNLLTAHKLYTTMAITCFSVYAFIPMLFLLQIN